MSKKKITRKTFEQLYKENKDTIIDRFMNANPALKKRNVKKLVREMFDSYRATSKSNEEAFRKLMHREEFISKEQRGAENLIKGIKEQGGFKDFRREVVGWRNKVNPNDIKWDDMAGGYKYNGWFIYQATTALGSPEWRWTR